MVLDCSPRPAGVDTSDCYNGRMDIQIAHIFWRLVTVCLLGVAAGCSSQSPPPAIFLGHIARLSGPDSKPGKSAEQGIRLALAELGPAWSEALSGRPLVVRHVD